MMSKTPVKDTSGQPVCYGAWYAEKRVPCIPCPFKGTCKVRSETWAERKSLSQMMEETFAAVTGIGVTSSFPDLYVKCYELTYGEKLWTASLEKPRAKLMLAKAEAFCRKENIEPELWITAQMLQMVPFVRDAKARGSRFCSFAPNMLLGKKAEHRYNVYIQRTNRRNKTVRIDGLAGEYVLYQAIGEIAHEESRLLWFLCESRIAGDKVSLDEARKELSMTPEWSYAAGFARSIPGATQDEVWRTDKVKVAGVLQGACDCAMGYHYKLPDRLGINLPFDRESFAEMISGLYPRRPAKTGSVPSHLGLAWPIR